MVPHKRLLIGLGLVAVGVLLFSGGPSALAQTGVPPSARPDVHLTFDIHADGSNVMTLEIAVHPLIDPAVRQGLDWLRQRMPKGTAATAVELRNTTREGRTYAALVAQLNSIGDLNAFVNTPQLLSSVLKPVDANITIPNIFSWFEVLRESSGSQTTYKINASIDEATARALAPINLTIHFRLPYPAQEHNADKVTETEISWRVPSDKSLTMTATATQRSLLQPFVGESGNARPLTTILVWIGVGILLVGLVIGVLLLIFRWRAGHTGERDDYDY